MGLLWASLEALAIMMAFSFVLMFVVMGVTIFWIRRKVVNKIYAYFIEPNRQITRELIPVAGSDKVTSKDGGDYMISPARTMWSKWPPGLPTWAQETVPTLLYSRNNVEPFDPANREAIITAQSLRAITDEGMLRATWKDAHEAANEGKILGRNWTTWMILGNLLVTAGLAFMLWLVFDTQSESSIDVQELLDIVKGL
ncbi:hypothetical protein LCGC14_0799030 [marine sediment metagenome]|uniref:Uncharacterized protein n=1 Tax=marine sediment metagenome TaxID=412755 RepID=A0A0F9PQ66_9ZZZZ